MKLSEVIAILEENPNKKFVSKNGKSTPMTARSIHGCIKFEHQNDLDVTSIDLTRDWQEVKQQVTWPEAIQAWMEGKSISCKIKDRYGAALYNFTNDVYLTNSRSTPISREMLQCGKWYIGEEE